MKTTARLLALAILVVEATSASSTISSNLPQPGRVVTSRRWGVTSSSSTPLRNEDIVVSAPSSSSLQTRQQDEQATSLVTSRTSVLNVAIRNTRGGATTAAVTATPAIGYTILRGALLRIASDLSGGTVLECIKTRTTLSKESMIEATTNIVREGGVLALWTGTQSRTVEGALVGAVFMLGSVLTKNRIKSLGGSPTVAALAGGLVGGVAQSLVMTPAGMIFTSLNYNKKRPGHEKDNAITVAQRIVHEKGLIGLYYGSGPMALRQASNWASRAGFTEIIRSFFGMSKYGLTGELISGCVGGLLSCWNTPIETIRVVMQRDVSISVSTKSMSAYWDDIMQREGLPGLFRGGIPRAIQAVWQTTFLVVVPNLMGI